MTDAQRIDKDVINAALLKVTLNAEPLYQIHPPPRLPRPPKAPLVPGALCLRRGVNLALRGQGGHLPVRVVWLRQLGCEGDEGDEGDRGRGPRGRGQRWRTRSRIDKDAINAALLKVIPHTEPSY